MVGRGGQITADRQLVEKSVVLEDNATRGDALFREIVAFASQVAATADLPAAIFLQQARQQLQKGALAAATRTQEQNDFPRSNLEARVSQELAAVGMV